MRRRDERGAALILVVVVVAALLAIGAPFLASMRYHERSSRAFSAQLRAQVTADAARNQAVARLMETHPDEERRAREARGDRRSDDEGHDDLGEVPIDRGFDPVTGLRALEAVSPTGLVAQVEVHDARGRIELNTAGPDAIANLLGVTVTTAALAYEEERELPVADASAFYSDDDPDTIDGFVRLGHEYIAYRHTTPTALQGLVRGFFFSRSPPPEDPDQRRDYFPAGMLVQDGRGYKVATDPLWRWVGTEREGQLARFENTAAIRRIADWEFGTLRAALVLFRYGVNLRQMRSWGLSERHLLGAGLDPAQFDESEAARQESEDERRERERAERQLDAWGVPPELVRRFGGDRAVRRAVRELERLDPEARDKLVASYQERARQLRDQLESLDRWLKDELGRQLAALSEMRSDAPHIETIGRIELEEKIRPYVTVDSLPEGADWSDSQSVNHRVEFEPYDWVTRLRVQDPRRFFAGQVVRVRPRDGRPPEYRLCVNSRADRVALFPQLDHDYEAREVEISCRQPRPVNVNVASWRVLTAVLTGLQGRIGQPQRAATRAAPDIVTPAEAEAIATAITEDPPSSHEELRGLLLRLHAEGRLTPQDVEAVYRNAIDPGDDSLARGTVPFCYATGDVYELVATAAVNDPSGIEVARHRYREVVQVAPPRELVWHVDSQADFTDRVYVRGGGRQRRGRERDRSGMSYLTLPGRWSNLLLSQPVHLGPYGAQPDRWPSRTHDPGEGDVRPLLAKEPDWRAGSATAAGVRPGRLAQREWPEELEGVPVGSQSLAAGDLGLRTLPYEPLSSGGTLPPREVLGPTCIRGWFRLDQLPAGNDKAFLFDGGRGDSVDRVSLYLQAGELVLAVHDEALDARESASQGLPPRATELRYRPPQPLQAGNWYHVAAFVRGADRGDLALAVDGRFVGEERHGSRLSARIDATQLEIPVEDPSRFPDSGWIRIGRSRTNANLQAHRGVGNDDRDANVNCEVLHYTKQGSLLVCDQIDVTLPNAMARVQNAGGQVQGVTQSQPGVPQPQPVAFVPPQARWPRRGSIRGGYQLTFQLPGQPRPQTRPVPYGGVPHEAGTLVVPYGYQSWLAVEPPDGYSNVLRRGNGTLTDPLPAHTPSTLLYAPQPGGYTWAAYNNRFVPFDAYPQVVDATATELPVIWAGSDRDQNVLGHWPDEGIVRVSCNLSGREGVERIYYRGIDRQAGRLLNCVRGVDPALPPVPHYLFDEVRLETIRLTDTRDYPQSATGRTYISVGGDRGDPEWLAVFHPLDTWPSAPALRARGLLIAAVVRSPTDRLADFPYADKGLWSMFQQVGLPRPAPGAPGAPQGLVKELLDGNGTLLGVPALVQVATAAAQGGNPPATTVLKELLKVLETDSPARATKGTARPAPATGHPARSEAVPTFSLRGRDREEADRGDVVTVTDDQALDPVREEQEIAWAAAADSGNGWLLAFRTFVQREYRADAHARIARWPVGNFTSRPDLVLGQARPPSGPTDVSADLPGTLSGRVDDLVTMQLDEQAPLSTPTTAADTRLGAAGQDPSPWQAGRLFLIDGEAVVSFDARGGAGGVQADVLRGALGTQARAHSPETSSWELDWPALAVVSGLPQGGPQVPMVAIRGGDRFRAADGYAAVDRGGGAPFAGIFSYDERGNGQLGLPVDRYDRTAFWSAFGHDRAVLRPGDVLVDLPFRVHDRYAPATSSLEGVFFQSARELPGAYVTRVTWDEALPTGLCEVKVALRLDGEPGWDAEPVRSPGQPGLYLFDDPRADNLVLRRADRVELRLYVTFKPGAYLADAWKRAAVVGAIRVHYRQPTRTIRREERSD